MDVTPGFTFIDADLVNLCSDPNLETFMTAAVFSNMELDDFKSNERPIFKGASQPLGSNLGQLWWIPQTNGDPANPIGILVGFDGAKYFPLCEGTVCTNKGSFDFQYGDVVAVMPPLSTDTFSTDRAQDHTTGSRLAGVCAQNIPINSSGFIITRGLCVIRTLSGTPVNWGALLKSGGVGSGAATADTQLVTKNCFGRLIDKTRKIAYICGTWKAT